MVVGYSAPSGSAFGGAGGAGYGYRGDSSWMLRTAGGGAGNPGGKCGESGLGNKEVGSGENGTGGLLIIYVDALENYGKIESSGSMGGSAGHAGGGSSGGGSINIFYNKSIKQGGVIEAKGGNESKLSNGYGNGGKGGDGTISVGNVSTGNYENTSI